MTKRDLLGSFEWLKLRLTYQVTLKFPGLNRYELLTLLMLDNYTRKRGKEIVSRHNFLDSISGNYKNRQKVYGYCEGLLNKGFLGSFEYVSSPGSVCIGISETGFAAIDQLLIEFDKLNKAEMKRYKPYMKRKTGRYIPIIRVAA